MCAGPVIDVAQQTFLRCKMSDVSLLKSLWFLTHLL